MDVTAFREIFEASSMADESEVLASLVRQPGLLAKLIPQEPGQDLSKIVDSLCKVRDNAFAQAYLPETTAKCRAQHCDLLCTLIDTCRRSKLAEIRSVVKRDAVWDKFFVIYLERSGGAIAKSLRRVLVALGEIITKDEGSDSEEFRNAVTERLLGTLLDQADRVRMKPAVQALTRFISTGAITVERLARVHHSRKRKLSGHDRLENSFQNLLRRLFDLVPYHDLANATGLLVSQIISKTRSSQDVPAKLPSGAPIWAEPLENALFCNPEGVSNFYHHVFLSIFPLDPEDYRDFLIILGLHDLLDQRKGQAVASHRVEETARKELRKILLFKAFRAGKELGIIVDEDATSKGGEKQVSSVAIPLAVFEGGLLNDSPAVRFEALQTLIEDKTTTAPLSPKTIKVLENHLPQLHGTTDPRYRGELVSTIKHIIDRLRGAVSRLVKLTRSREGSVGLLSAHQDFISWYIRFILVELHPTSPYPNHIAALQALEIFVRSGLDPRIRQEDLAKSALGEIKWNIDRIILNGGLIRQLIDLLVDPYDDVRTVSMNILRLGVHSGQVAPTEIVVALQRAESLMLKTSRADHADGVARLYSLLMTITGDLGGKANPSYSLPLWLTDRQSVMDHLVASLEDTVRVALEDLHLAVSNLPLHGLFSALRYIVESPGFYSHALESSEAGDINPQNWANYHGRIFTCIHSVWRAVKEILCNDAPEGHVPEEMEGTPDLTTSDILSYSWRALKESSLLARSIITKAPYGMDSHSNMILGPVNIEDLGNLCFVQLAELRHRGAFSTVAQTFEACCLRCSALGGDVATLPLKWYDEAHAYVGEKTALGTRRSAGIPSLLASTLNPDKDLDQFDKAIKDLVAKSSASNSKATEQENALAQVHAMNCLKEIFTRNRFARYSDKYLMEGISLAFTKFQSKSWPIRNCGLMLFRALTDRITGGSKADDDSMEDSKASIVTAIRNHPELLRMMMNVLESQALLEEDNQTMDSSTDSVQFTTEAIFPILRLLQQELPPNILEQTRDALLTYVLRFCISSHWHVRDMAARTYAALSRNSDAALQVLVFLEKLEDPLSENETQGYLLCVEYILRKLPVQDTERTNDTLASVQPSLTAALSHVYKTRSPFIREKYVDILKVFSLKLLAVQAKDQNIAHPLTAAIYELFRNVLDDFEAHVKTLGSEDDVGNLLAGSARMRRAMAELFIYSCVFQSHAEGGHPFASELTELGRDSRRLDAYLGFAHNDLDTCHRCLESLYIRLQQGLSLNPRQQAAAIALAQRLATEIQDSSVKSSAQMVLTALLQTSQNLQATLDDGLKSTLAAMRLPYYGDMDLLQPTLVHSTIILQGALIDAQLRLGRLWNTGVQQDLYSLAATLRIMLHEHNELPSREAAVGALSGLRHLWQHMLSDGSLAVKNSALHLQLSLATYDALNDDDEDIRDMAKEVAIRIMEAQPDAMSPLKRIGGSPLTVSETLAKFIAKVHARSDRLAGEGLKRLLAYDDSRSSLLPSPAELLEAAQAEDAALFAVEKQNLYIDEARECYIWSLILKSCYSLGVSSGEATKLAEWALQGLCAVKATLAAKKPGPMNWTSKLEVFALGLRIIYAADVSLYWSRRSLEATALASELQQGLAEFLAVASEDAGRRAHPLWVELATRVQEDRSQGTVAFPGAFTLGIPFSH